jgi:hypothetical protein
MTVAKSPCNQVAAPNGCEIPPHELNWENHNENQAPTLQPPPLHPFMPRTLGTHGIVGNGWTYKTIILRWA